MGKGAKREASQGRHDSSTFLRMVANEGLRSSTTSSGRNISATSSGRSVNARATQHNATPSKVDFSLYVTSSHEGVDILGASGYCGKPNYSLPVTSSHEGVDILGLSRHCPSLPTAPSSESVGRIGSSREISSLELYRASDPEKQKKIRLFVWVGTGGGH